MRNVVSLLRTLATPPANSDRTSGAGTVRGQSPVPAKSGLEGLNSSPAGQVLDQPRLTAVQLEYSPPAGGFDPYARRGTYLDITV